MSKSLKKKKLDTVEDLPLIYEQYKSELKGYIATRVDSSEEAEDILQDVFYNLLKVDFVESPIEYISAWLYQAASNKITDRYRKKKEESLTGKNLNDDDEYFLETLSDYLADEGDDPEIIFRNNLIKEEIESALSELPPEQRSVFELTEYDGISYKEIAESIGVSVPTLLSRKHYAINHLRKKLLQLYLDMIEK